MQVATENPDEGVLFVCDMSAMTPIERQQHIATTREVFGAVQEIRELPNGYSFRLADEEGIFMQAAAFLSKERLCCPFFGFGIEIEPKGGGGVVRADRSRGSETVHQGGVREGAAGCARPKSEVCVIPREDYAEPHWEDTT